MFDEIEFYKNIENNRLVKEYKKLHKKYIEHSDYKYKKQNDYLKKLVFQNKKNNSIFVIEKNIKKEYKKYKKLTYLKVKELERVSKELDLIPVFFTLTVPSKYHPFRKSINNKYTLNNNFEFIEVEERVTKSYEFLNKIYREFYLNVKNNKKNKDMKFIKITENHKSLICHSHFIFYIKKDTFDTVEKQFNKIVNKYSVIMTDCQKINYTGSSYIIKYLLKSFRTDELKKFDGWKKLHKIRLFTMSNLALNTDIFKKMYYNNRKHNINILKDIKAKKINYNNLYEYYTKNTTVKTIYKMVKLKKNKKKEYEYIIEPRIKYKNKNIENRFYFGRVIYVYDKKIHMGLKFHYEKKIEYEKKFIESKIVNKKQLCEIYYKNKYKNKCIKTEYEIIEKIDLNRFHIKLYSYDSILKKDKKYKLSNYGIKDNLKDSILMSKNDYEVQKINLEELQKFDFIEKDKL